MDADLRQYLRIVRKRWWIVALALVGALGFSSFMTARATRVYTAEAKVAVGFEPFSGPQFTVGSSGLVLAEQLLSTLAVTIATRPIAELAVQRGNLPISASQVKGGVSARRLGATHILAVTFSSADPELAALAANAVAGAFEARVEGTRQSQTIQPSQVAEPSETTRPAGTQASEGGAPVSIEVIEQAEVPGSPISPKPIQNGFLAIVIGLGIGVGLVLVAESLDVTVKSREDIEGLGLALIGTVPSLHTRTGEVYLEMDAQGPAGEAFRKLRTAIGFTALEKPVQVILVTSPHSGEGKTTVALNLAVAYAHTGLKTLLLEADLRRPSLHTLFKTENTHGLTTAVIGQISVDQAIQPTTMDNFSIILAAAIPPNPVELLDSAGMLHILENLRRAFDIVIVDTPPLVPVADPATLASRVDGVLLVARAGSTHRKRMSESADLIARAGGRLLGVVLNRQRPLDSPYEYGYYYSYRAAVGQKR